MTTSTDTPDVEGSRSDPDSGDGATGDVESRTTAVTALELLLDLVFVAAIGQLATTLHEDISWIGGLRTIVLWVPLYLLWANTAFSVTGTITENRPLNRPVLWVLFLGVFMAGGIPMAFEEGHECLAFVIPYLLAQIGQVVRSWLGHARDEMRAHARNMLVWHGPAAAGWIVGAILSPGPRLWVWLATVAVEVTGLLLRHPFVRGGRVDTSEWQFDSAHMLERIRLFLILALGEQVVSIVAGLHEAGFHILTLVSASASVVTFFTLWWLYGWDLEFQLETDPAEHNDPARAGARAIAVQLILALGLIPMAVSDEIVITEPSATGTLHLGLLLCGGAIIYLLAQAWALWRVTGDFPTPRAIATAVLVVLEGLAALLPAVVTNAAAALVLIGLALVTRQLHLRRDQVDPTRHDRIVEK